MPTEAATSTASTPSPRPSNCTPEAIDALKHGLLAGTVAQYRDVRTLRNRI
jgi:hypothetical protein